MTRSDCARALQICGTGSLEIFTMVSEKPQLKCLRKQFRIFSISTDFEITNTQKTYLL